MKVLLVEPAYRKGSQALADSVIRQGSFMESRAAKSDESLWYPPLGLMKLSRFHKDRGDAVQFVVGCPKSILEPSAMLNENVPWDRVYITTLFTFDFESIVRTINFYKAAVGYTTGKIFVGGIMSTLMAEDIFKETGVYPTLGVVSSARQIRIEDDTNVDQLTPDYECLKGLPYAVNDTYYAYTSRGCINKCPWCGVPKIEPVYLPYIDVKPAISSLRQQYGDKGRLKLMDNNVLASPELPKIVDDLVTLGYGRDAALTASRKRRVVDFNQGLDASFINPDTLAQVSRLNIKPFRIAFDSIKEKDVYVAAVRLAVEGGFNEISNYMLYNFKDTPSDLYQRLVTNIVLNEVYSWSADKVFGKIYCYPMRYAPIDERGGRQANRHRDLFVDTEVSSIDWLRSPVWTRRFVRNVEIMKSAANGTISPTCGLAWRTIGHTFEEFICNLYMPEELLRNRNLHEMKVYTYEPRRQRGSGLVEEFRDFVLGLISRRDGRFEFFHNAVSPNSTEVVRRFLKESKDQEITRWLQMYVR